MHRQAYVFLCLTTLFWGGNAVASRLAVGHVSPMML
ncbi:MAG: EamA family transporter, partial [Nitratireductor sp.]